MDVNSLLYLTMNFTVWKLNAVFDKNIFYVTALAIILAFLIVPITAINAQQSKLVVTGLSNGTQDNPFDKSTFTQAYNRSLERTNFLTLNTNEFNEASDPGGLPEHLSESSNSYITTLPIDKNASTARNHTTTITMKTFHLNNTLLMVTLKGENISIFFGSPKNNDHFDE